MKISLEFLVVVTAKLPQPAAGTKCVCVWLCVQLTGSSRTLFESGRRAHSEGNCDMSRRADSTWLKANAKRTRNTDKRLTELTLFLLRLLLLLLRLCHFIFSRGLPNFKANPKLFAWVRQAEKQRKDEERQEQKKKMQIALLSLPNGRKREPKNAEKYQKYLFQLCIIKSFLCSIDTHTNTHKAHTVPEATKLGLIQLWPTVCDTRTFSISSSSTYITYTYILTVYTSMCTLYGHISDTLSRLSTWLHSWRSLCLHTWVTTILWHNNEGHKGSTSTHSWVKLRL